MAYIAADLAQITSLNGYGYYRYDTLDTPVTVETAGYFNNTDDTLRLAIGDKIEVWTWATATRTGTLSRYGEVAVTNIANGIVNVAEIGVSTTSAISSRA